MTLTLSVAVGDINYLITRYVPSTLVKVKMICKAGIHNEAMLQTFAGRSFHVVNFLFTVPGKLKVYNMTTTSHFSLCSIYGCGKKRFSKKRTYKEISPSTPQVGHRDAVQRIIKERSFFEIKYGRQAMTPIVSCTERVRLFWLTTQLLLVNDSIKLFPICLIPSYKSEEDHRNYPEH